MKTSNKILLIVCAILIGLIPISAQLLKTQLPSRAINMINDPFDGEINVVVIEKLNYSHLEIKPGKNAIEMPDFLKDSILIKTRKDTLYIKDERHSPNNTGYFLHLNLVNCPNVIVNKVNSGAGTIEIRNFNSAKRMLDFTLQSGQLVLDSFTADSIDFDIKNGSIILRRNTKFDYMNLKATESELTLDSEEIKTINGKVDSTVSVSGLMKNIRLLLNSTK
ncbi:hypothetical protein C3K47_03090 [Solitalea longa]|uniref:Uncharacterized protein n=1 Tax=Solitalea longa TaxID=2079460 RepID=A0A2S5A7X6_9SPHI|nr:hypothetical protein [Solitalea longa]POY38399.1 hypothetical protein C3K47_03090 [Solitalea longa]